MMSSMQVGLHAAQRIAHARAFHLEHPATVAAGVASRRSLSSSGIRLSDVDLDAAQRQIIDRRSG
jgi:hypothetical protein